MQIVKNNKHFVLSLFTWILDSNLKDGDIVKVPHNEQQRPKLESFIRLFVQKEHWTAPEFVCNYEVQQKQISMI